MGFWVHLAVLDSKQNEFACHKTPRQWSNVLAFLVSIVLVQTPASPVVFIMVVHFLCKDVERPFLTFSALY